MTIEEATILIQQGTWLDNKISTWADLGCGSGTFTQALAELLTEGSFLYAVDKTLIENFPTSNKVEIKLIKNDFERDPLPIPEIDGIIMANSLHYIKDKSALLTKIKMHLKENGHLIIVEYDTDKSNSWVPYPIPFSQLQEELKNVGFHHVKKIGERNSIYGPQKMYACLAKTI